MTSSSSPLDGLVTGTYIRIVIMKTLIAGGLVFVFV